VKEQKGRITELIRSKREMIDEYKVCLQLIINGKKSAVTYFTGIEVAIKSCFKIIFPKLVIIAKQFFLRANPQNNFLIIMLGTPVFC
jgi:hypothetical protein